MAPERYAALTHPGDAFAFDIFSQAGAALRTGAGPLAHLAVETPLAVGESQSATFLVTYVNAVDPWAGIYDGFVIHGRGASGAPRVRPRTLSTSGPRSNSSSTSSRFTYETLAMTPRLTEPLWCGVIMPCASRPRRARGAGRRHPD